MRKPLQIAVPSRICKGLISMVLCAYATGVFACKPKVNLGEQISFCAGNSVTLNASYPNSVYYWSNGQVTPSITVSVSGTYWVSVTNNCGNTLDTIEVYVDQPLNLNLGGTQSYCKGSGKLLRAPASPSYQYTWQDGSADSTFWATQPGTYYVSLQNACGVFSDTVILSEEDPPPLDLGNDIIKCDNSPVTLHSGVNHQVVHWSTAQSGSGITVSQSGTYWATASNSCGTFYDTVEVYYSKGPSLHLGGTVSLCSGGTLVLDPGGGEVPAYLWSTGATSDTLEVTSPGTYWVRLTDACGVFYDTVTVVATGPAQVNLGADTVLCVGQPLTIDAGFPGSKYWWSNNAIGQSIQIQKGGTYWVGVDNGCGYQYDTIVVSSIIPPHDTLPDTLTVCPGQGYVRTVDAGDWGPQTSYFWDDHSQARTHSYTQAGNHWVVVTNPCGTDTSYFTLIDDQPYTVDLGRDTIICGSQLNLWSGKLTPYDTVSWSTGEVGLETITVHTSGEYWVEVSNACGRFRDTINVVFLGPPGKIFPHNSSLCTGSTQKLWMTHQPATHYHWSTGDTTASIFISQPGTYWATSYNLCDTVTDTVTVTASYPISVDLGPDDTICEGQVKMLNSNASGADSIWWNTGTGAGWMPLTQPGTYWVEVYNACGMFSDTLHLSVKELPKKKLQPVTFCSDTSYILDVTQNRPSSYLWNTGDTTSTLTVHQTGGYTVRITNDCGTLKDSVWVQAQSAIPPFTLGPDTVFCQGSITLDPGFYPGASYTWQNGQRSQTLIADRSGLYTVRVENSCNTRYDTIEVLVTGPPKLILGTEVRFCHVNSLTLDAHNPGCDYHWNTGATTQSINVDTSGTFWCTISNACGVLTDTVEVVVEYDLDQLNLGRDTSLCEGDTLLLNTGYPQARTRWQDGTREPELKVSETGWYSVEVFNTCGQWEDSIYVAFNGIPAFSLGPDTGICADQGQLHLKGPPGMASYQWSNGDNTRGTVFHHPGLHWLEVSNGCFTYRDSIQALEEYPVTVDLGPDTVLCITDPYSLYTDSQGYPVLWEDGSRGNSREVSSTGTYIASVRNSCGWFRDTVQVRFDEILNLPLSDTLLCRDDTLEVDLRNVPFDLVWFDGSEERVRSFAAEGSYPLWITNTCGTFLREYQITLSNCDCPLYVPNSFTPNGDGLNDQFSIGHSCDLRHYQLEIFDRWGTLVFSTSDPEASWDGTFKGLPLPIGAYSFHMFYKWNVYQADRQKTRYGTITLIR